MGEGGNRHRIGQLAVAACLILPACTADPTAVTPSATTSPDPTGAATEPVDGSTEPPPAEVDWADVTVVVDPGHQLGNSRFPGQAGRQRPAGGFSTTCNSTGTSTDAGFPEATFTFRVAQRLRRLLERRGARVVMTRTANSVDLWGPCIDERGRAGNRVDADLKVSIHADGSYTDGRGFHVIAPTDRPPWTSDIYRSSKLLAGDLKRGLVRTGFAPADYVAGGDGLDFRADLGTLNLSDVPAVVVETGNMRNAREARVMSTSRGQYRYALSLLRGIRRFLSR
jgi:N-acetylmuramoyl-L-alanine amidase